MMATAGEGETDEEETAAALMSLSRTNAAPAASRAPPHPFATYAPTFVYPSAHVCLCVGI
jgi:hypothetical protein